MVVGREPLSALNRFSSFSRKHLMHDHERWQAVLDRNQDYDGQFVFAVHTTGIYCRPSCPSRRPRRENVQFFALPNQAEQAGFRPCRRCQPDQAGRDEPHQALIQQICRVLDEAGEHIPTLDELGQQFHLSPYHLQRTFKRLVGVTPRQYAAARRLDRFKAHLKEGETVTEAVYEAGYPSSSSAYEQTLGMTPAHYRRRGQGLDITYAITPCALGWLLVAATGRGVCAVRLGDSEAELETLLAEEFPDAALERGDLDQEVAALLDYLSGTQPRLDLPLDVQATAFQRRVWDVLRTIPYGSTRSYQEVAEALGQPSAVRAVARACATNPAALVIPCHRVVRADGSLAGYRWGIARKQALLAMESDGAEGAHAGAPLQRGVPS
jgi:AraC family transcriptional regulator of adaptative response/methylated-DNA-[protein]-cysteine methyltransferase